MAALLYERLLWVSYSAFKKFNHAIKHAHINQIFIIKHAITEKKMRNLKRG